MKEKLLILNQEQFGYHIDTFNYCHYLKRSFDIEYIGWDYNKEKVTIDGVKANYIPRNGNIIIRNLRYIYQVLLFLWKRPDIKKVFLVYFRGCSLIKLLVFDKKFVLDIRTGSVSKNKFYRILYNKILKYESIFFSRVTIISKNLAIYLKLNRRQNKLLPLGAKIIPNDNRKFDEIKLLYVGTLYNRNIETTIYGFKKFVSEFSENINISYTIIGGGDNQEKHLVDIVQKLGLMEFVKILGPIHHSKIHKYLFASNVGVSFIPLTEYYDNQPPTKTFEYILAGMPVIATNTKENRKIINCVNGVLIDDTVDGFYRGLTLLYNNRLQYNSQKIIMSGIENTWENITIELEKYLLQIST